MLKEFMKPPAPYYMTSTVNAALPPKWIISTQFGVSNPGIVYVWNGIVFHMQHQTLLPGLRLQTSSVRTKKWYTVERLPLNKAIS